MSSDRSAIALERLAPSHASPASGKAAGVEDRPLAAAPASDLAALASALAHVEALVAAGADASPDAAAALERIADIAFILHEREVEPSLCDALDAAMREIGEANARNRASVQRAHEAMELLRTLAHRVDAMMSAQAVSAADGEPGAVEGLARNDELECADEFPAPVRLFEADIARDGAFAQAVAALAQSLPEHSDADPAQSQHDAAGSSGALPEALAHSDDVEPEQTETSASAWGEAENPVSGAGQQLAPGESFAATSAALPAPDAAAVASPALSASAAVAPDVDTHRSIDPDEDPGDLFEPTPDIRPAADAVVQPPTMSANTTQEPAGSASIAPQSLHNPAAAPAHGAARAAANDPLAPIRALSEEELIALFS